MIAPETIEEASEAIRAIAGRGEHLELCGAGTKVAVSDRCVSTRQLSRVIDYAPADMTITVEAGVTLAEIERITSEDNLRLALDPPHYDGRATIGGVLAANDSGPMRMTHGGPRDLVVGMTMILGDGTIVRSGGRVVKNVAGYGVHRLMVGSWGELGMIAAATLKLQPRPEALGIALIDVEGAEEADAITARVLSGGLRPTMVEWAWPGEHWGISGLAIAVCFEECHEAVAWQLDEFRQTEARAKIFSGEEAGRSYAWIREWDAAATCRAAIPSSAVCRVFRDSDKAVKMLAHAGSGCVLVIGDEAGILSRMQGIARECGGCIVRPRGDANSAHTRIRSQLRAALRMEPAAC